MYRDLFDEYKHLKTMIKSKRKELSALKGQTGPRENTERLVVVEAAIGNLVDHLPADFQFIRSERPVHDKRVEMQQREFVESQNYSSYEHALLAPKERNPKIATSTYESNPVPYYNENSNYRNGDLSTSGRIHLSNYPDDSTSEDCHYVAQRMESNNSARKKKVVKKSKSPRRPAEELQFSPTAVHPSTYSDLFKHDQELENFSRKREKAWGFTGGEVFAGAKGGKPKDLKIETDQAKPKKKTSATKPVGSRTSKSRTHTELVGNGSSTVTGSKKKQASGGLFKR